MADGKPKERWSRGLLLMGQVIPDPGSLHLLLLRQLSQEELLCGSSHTEAAASAVLSVAESAL